MGTVVGVVVGVVLIVGAVVGAVVGFVVGASVWVVNAAVAVVEASVGAEVTVVASVRLMVSVGFVASSRVDTEHPESNNTIANNAAIHFVGFLISSFPSAQLLAFVN